MANEPFVSDVIHRIHAVEHRRVVSDEAVVTTSRHRVGNPEKAAFKRTADEHRHAGRLVLPGPQITTGTPRPARKQSVVYDVLLAVVQGVCSWNKFDKRADDQRGHRGDCGADSRLGNSVVLRYFSLGPVPPEVLQGGSQRIPEAENWRPRPHPRLKPVGGNSIAQTCELGLGEPGGMIHVGDLFLAD